MHPEDCFYSISPTITSGQIDNTKSNIPIHLTVNKKPEEPKFAIITTNESYAIKKMEVYRCFINHGRHDV